MSLGANFNDRNFRGGVLSQLWVSVYFHNLPKAFILIWQSKMKLRELPKHKKEPFQRGYRYFLHPKDYRIFLMNRTH